MVVVMAARRVIPDMADPIHASFLIWRSLTETPLRNASLQRRWNQPGAKGVIPGPLVCQRYRASLRTPEKSSPIVASSLAA